MKLCSACLLGIRCRYDGKSKPDKEVIALSKKETLIPVCPEQLGGLPTPRKPSEGKGAKVITKSGKDVTKNFKIGASQVLKLARLLDIKEAIFKQRSAACGCGKIYDGSFSRKTIKGDGIATALLKKNGIKVMGEDALQHEK
ncbi:MAG: DUF523 domain-containing protein [Candidatus Omnitrophota bacterium]|nr:MAG: DUF523 domain-containing protein [Candidatus Omnitrophota bacterium]